MFSKNQTTLNKGKGESICLVSRHLRLHMFFRLYLSPGKVGPMEPATIDPTLDLFTRYPLQLGGPLGVRVITEVWRLHYSITFVYPDYWLEYILVLQFTSSVSCACTKWWTNPTTSQDTKPAISLAKTNPEQPRHSSAGLSSHYVSE